MLISVYANRSWVDGCEIDSKRFAHGEYKLTTIVVENPDERDLCVTLIGGSNTNHQIIKNAWNMLHKDDVEEKDCESELDQLLGMLYNNRPLTT